MPHDDEGYTCVQVVYGDPPRCAIWKVVDRYGRAIEGASDHADYAAARRQAEKMNAAVLAERFTP